MNAYTAALSVAPPNCCVLTSGCKNPLQEWFTCMKEGSEERFHSTDVQSLYSAAFFFFIETMIQSSTVKSLGFYFRVLALFNSSSLNGYHTFFRKSSRTGPNYLRWKVSESSAQSIKQTVRTGFGYIDDFIFMNLCTCSVGGVNEGHTTTQSKKCACLYVRLRDRLAMLKYILAMKRCSERDLNLPASEII